MFEVKMKGKVKMKEKYDGIIFDLDGTIWNTTDIVAEDWQRVIDSHKEINTEITLKDIQGVMGLQIHEIGEKLFPEVEPDIRKKILKECCQSDNEYLKVHGGKLYDGVVETIKRLSSVTKLFIVSNCTEGYIEAFLEGHGMQDYFTDFENPGRTGLTKGENIRLIIERNCLKNAIYIGDTEGDRKAAKAAGIPFVYASYGFGDVKEYLYKIDSFNQLEDICM